MPKHYCEAAFADILLVTSCLAKIKQLNNCKDNNFLASQWRKSSENKLKSLGPKSLKDKFWGWETDVEK